jgi:ABC-2 type transport system permease protein
MTRVLRLARTEGVLLRRNRMAVFTALLLPVVALAALDGANPDPDGPLAGGAFAVTATIGFVLLFVVYYNLVTAYVARRETLVLKRLRTGEASDASILTAVALPTAAIALAQVLALVAGGTLVLDLPVPVNGLLIVAGTVAGIAVFVLLAAVSTRFTGTVEMAQLSTLPVLLVCMVGSGATVPLDALPEPLADIAAKLPLTPVLDLVRLGWLGTTGGSAPVGFAETFAGAVQPLFTLAAWLVFGALGVRAWFRWEPRH